MKCGNSNKFMTRRGLRHMHFAYFVTVILIMVKRILLATWRNISWDITKWNMNISWVTDQGRTKSVNQQKLTNFNFSDSSNAESQECLLHWIIDAYQPLATVQRDSFRKYVHSLNKKALVIGEDKIQSMLSTKYFDTQQQITNILKGKSLSLTTDAWTSIAKERYITCTPHFIQPVTWTLHYFSLGIFKKDGTSTAVDVICYAEEHMTKFNITYPQLTCIVTDTEATISMGLAMLHKMKKDKCCGPMR